MAVRTIVRSYSIFPQHERDLIKLSKKAKSPMSELVREAIGLLVEKYQEMKSIPAERVASSEGDKKVK